jgi:putative RNA 2'-phosphotransferase
MDRRLVRLSTVLAKALRHTPWLFELEMDDDGWVSVESMLDALHEQPRWHDVTEADFAEIIAQSEKRRYEMIDGRIRALYGHSTPNKLRKTPAAPPEILYHGTTSTALPVILETGLLPMRRQYIHFSVDEETASLVGHRKGDDVVLLAVRAAEAHRDGIAFYQGNESVWLADNIPAKYIDIRSESVFHTSG